MSALTVAGPVQGGSHGWPYAATTSDLASLGYVEEEYFVSGEARAYRPKDALPPDGLWDVEPVGSAPFTTRILVRRPADPSRFNGTVLCEWNNVTAGFEVLVNSETPTLYEGFGFVGVTAQYAGVVGFESLPMGLTTWDPQRYSELFHPGDAYSFDIFTQVGRLVGPGREVTGIDPLGGLTVKNIIANGSSQSAQRLLSYANAIQPVERVFNGFLTTVGTGTGSGFDNRVLEPAQLASASPAEFEALLGTPSRFRGDLNVPVMQLNSECEAVLYARSRQPDTELFRFWEVAGASHAPGPMMAELQTMLSRDFGMPVEIAPELSDATAVPSTVDWRPTFGAALTHVKEWIEGGNAPPIQNRIELAPDASIVRDELGNAKGGVRLPDLEAPLAVYDGGGTKPGTIDLGGRTTLLSRDQLATIYASRDDYISRVEKAAAAALRAGVIPPWKASQYVAAAGAVSAELFPTVEHASS